MCVLVSKCVCAHNEQTIVSWLRCCCATKICNEMSGNFGLADNNKEQMK